MKAILVAAAFACLATPAQALLCVPLVGCSCTVTAADLEFGTFNPLSGDQQGEGQVSVDCTGIADVAPSVTATMGAGQWGTIAARKMRASSGDLLTYNIYTTAQRTAIWGGGGTGSSVTISGGLLSVGHWTVTRGVYGTASPTTETKPGLYQDQVVVRIVW